MADWLISKILIHRSLGFIYFIAFLVAWNQFCALCGPNGLLPMRNFMANSSWKHAPSIFWKAHSERFLKSCAGCGILLSLLCMTGLSDQYGWLFSIFCWSVLWVLYLSFVNTGQTFYGFGWESMLLETGFLAIFLGPDSVKSPYPFLLLFQWLLFRNMFGAGLIKLRGDRCWKKLTCLKYHFETQPLPNPLSRFCHFLPEKILKSGVIFNHLVEVILPFLYFFPGPLSYTAGSLTLLFQLFLIVSGNFSWLNYLTCVQCLACFDDAFYHSWLGLQNLPEAAPPSATYWLASMILFAILAYLSRKPIKNLISKHQVMNTSFDNLHILNTYGAFGSITRPRYELIIERTSDNPSAQEATWTPYHFKAKPGDLNQKPPIVAPYHYRLDWLMWFAAMSSYHQHPWIISLVKKLLQEDPSTLKLLKGEPPSSPPKYIRIKRYIYRFKKGCRAPYWEREEVDEYLPPVSLENEGLNNFLHIRGL